MLFGLTLAAALFGRTATAATAVCFYEHTNYAGASYCVDVGTANSAPSGWNDRVSSVRVYSGYRAELFQNSNLGGTVLILTADEPNLVNRSFNDAMSSYRVTAVAATGPVCFYEHTNYGGASFCSGEGNFEVPSGWNDRASSAKVQAGYRVDMYANSAQTGTLVTLTADEPNFVARSFNDVMTSFRVSKAATNDSCSGVFEWNATTQYAALARATLQGQLYESNRATKNEIPIGTSGAWRLVAACTGGVPVGPMSNSSLFNPRCYPATVNVVVSDAAGLTPLSNRLPVANMPAVVKQIAANLCSILYKSASEVPVNYTTINLTFSNFDGVAYTSGNSVTFSTQHIQNVANAGQDVLREALGVLYHEITHIYQNNDSDASPRAAELGGTIEGVADFTRYVAGYKTYANRSKGGSWSGGYDTTAFFLEYLNRTYVDFVYRFNQQMSSTDGRTWTPAVFQTLTGKSVDTLWAEYQASF
jgi:hypothetical protein